MTAVFDPTLVPKGTLKTMAKRMHKHPDGQHLTLAQCQELLAQTFGHTSWHALQHFQRPDRSGHLLAHAPQRSLFYATLLQFLEAGVGVTEGLALVKTAAQRLERWEWADLAQRMMDDWEAGKDTGEALSMRVLPYSSMEAFLLKQSSRSEGLIAALRETKALSDQSLHYPSNATTGELA